MPTFQYFAGHFDGEGCIQMVPHNQGWRLYAEASGCYKPVIEAYKTAFCGYVSGDTHGAKNKPLFVWRLFHQAKLLEFFQAIVPFSMEKKSQIDVGIDWLLERQKYPRCRVPDSFIAYGAECAQILRDLKRFSF